MPRPPGANPDTPANHVVDALHAARSGLSLERQFGVDELPRLRDASLGTDGQMDGQIDGEIDGVAAKFVFSLLEERPAIDGEMSGSVRLKCQRCLQPVTVPVAEQFQIVLVGDDTAPSEEFGAYEPIAVEAGRLDLQWLAEEQSLLALPLVPLHEPGECDEAVETPVAVAVEPGKQKPFGNLRDLLQKRN